MTVHEAARLLGVSASTVYRRIRAGTIKATKVGRRWKVEGVGMDWHPQVHKGFAKKDGRKPEEFQWDQWPISNLTLRHPISEPGDIALIGLCDMPVEPPRANRYDDNDKPLPDPKGITFSRVKFQLHDVETGEKLAESVSGYFDGQVRCGFANRELTALWDVLSPGNRPIDPAVSVRVQVTAFPLFYYLAENGAAMLAYANMNNGYFSGEEIQSLVYALSMSEHHELLIDGAKVQPPAAPDESEEDRRSREEGDRIMREEREAHERMMREAHLRTERENREHNERMDRERREQEEAQRQARDEADVIARREREEHEREKRRAAKERERLGIRAPSGDVWQALTEPPNDDGHYMALVNLWTAQYDPDQNAYKERLREIRSMDGFADAVDEVYRRMGWTL